MKLNKQRIDGAKAAQSANAEKTLKIINDEKSNYKTILKTAAEEAGVDALVAYCLKGDPELAYQTLLHIQRLGPHREVLIKKASESPELAALIHRNIPNIENHNEFLVKKSGKFAKSLGEISGFNLHNGGGYIAYFTMYWVTGNAQYPTKGAKKVWSDKILLGQNDTKLCDFFPSEDEPLVAGSEVWIYLYVQAGCDVESPLKFTYNPNTLDLAYFICTGTTTSATLGYSKTAAPKS